MVVQMRKEEQELTDKAGRTEISENGIGFRLSYLNVFK